MMQESQTTELVVLTVFRFRDAAAIGIDSNVLKTLLKRRFPFIPAVFRSANSQSGGVDRRYRQNRFLSTQIAIKLRFPLRSAVLRSANTINHQPGGAGCSKV